MTNPADTRRDRAYGEILRLDELLDITYARWAMDPEWRRRGIVRPAITDLQTYALFERLGVPQVLPLVAPLGEASAPAVEQAAREPGRRARWSSPRTAAATRLRASPTRS